MHVSTIIGDKGNAVYTIEPGQMLSDAVNVLCEKRIGALVVVSGAQVEGILTERDIMHALHKDGGTILSRPVRDYMTSEVMACKMTDSVDYIRSLMTSQRFRHMPVIEDGLLQGMVSIGDVVKSRIAEVEAETDALKSYIASG
ncbi:MAG: CBS domain-containing protein [Alphaproteobacteria bacterium]|nr:MAG: CBS domain-containing protein [Alphaproteobacteria bacterium]